MIDRASELRAIADGRLMLNVRNGVTVARSMLARIADEFEAMSTALAAKDVELAQVIKTGFERCADISDRAERAEAQLAEARKALEIADAFFRCIRFDRDRDTFAAEAVDAIRAARRVLEGGGDV